MTTKATPAKFFAFGGTLFVAIMALMVAIVLPKTNTNDQSKAALATSCAGSTVVPAAICGEKCIVNEDCSSGLTCYKLDLFSVCRNPQNLTNAECAAAASSVPSSSPSTKPGTVATPTPPAGCTYQQVQCIQAPCNPILVCPSPTPVPGQAVGSHVVKLVNKPTGTATMYMDFDAIVEDGVTTQETSSRFTYSGTWTTGSSVSLNGGTNRFTGTSGGSVQFTTTAKSLIVYSTKQSNMGSIDVYVDGVLKTNVPMTAPTSQYQQKVDLSSYVAALAPTKPPVADLPTPPAGCTYQQVQCIQAPCDPILVCSSHVVKFVFRSTAAGQNMAIDYIKDGTTVIDDNSALLTYTGTWIKGTDSAPYGGAYTATSTNGSAISYSTKSPSIIVRPFRYSTRGVLDVYVDGVLKRSITDLATGSGWTDISIVVTP